MPPDRHHRGLALEEGRGGIRFIERRGARRRDVVLQDVGGEVVGRLVAGLAGEDRLQVLVEQVAAGTPEEIVPDHEVLAVLLAVGDGDARDIRIPVLDGLAAGADLFPGFRGLQAGLVEEILAIPHELHVAAHRQAVEAGGELAGVQERVGIFRQVDAARRDHVVDRLQVAVDQRRDPDVHDGRDVEIAGLADHLGRQAFAQGNERDIDVVDLDAGQFGEGLGVLLVGRELRGLNGKDVDFLPVKGLAGRYGKGRPQVSPQHVGHRDCSCTTK